LLHLESERPLAACARCAGDGEIISDRHQACRIFYLPAIARGRLLCQSDNDAVTWGGVDVLAALCLCEHKLCYGFL
jgi:hypothetical protein